ncbi:hypothetical protein [Yoonia sp. 208BN28-4]|uniref:hypothetical protein n=1 Tax=Yoonia sp. 208BN28-4 TaxID=3126505 RepID=UPI00309B7DAA
MMVPFMGPEAEQMNFHAIARHVAFATILTGAAPLWADPLLSVAGTMDASEDYAVVLDALDAIDADATNLTLYWDLMAPDGAYAPDPDWPAIANLIYPAADLQVSLNIAVVDMVADRRPVALQQRAFSDPEVIAAFDEFLTTVMAAMPDVTFTSIGIGNEVDGYLDDVTIDEYAVFFAAASDTIHRLAPEVPVGMTVTWDGLEDNPQIQALAALGDVWMINYYPLTPEFQARDPRNTAADLVDMLAMAGRKPVFLTEAGYPSGGCGASEAMQLAFVQQVDQFAAANAAKMPLVTYVWLHDLSEESVTAYADYYGNPSECFSAFLGTLGLRSHTGRDKAAYSWLRNR